MQGRQCCFFGGVKSLVDMGIEVRFHMNESLWQIIIRFLQHWELCEKTRHRAEVAQVKIRDDKCQNKRL